jgi:hypothetical protein
VFVRVCACVCPFVCEYGACVVCVCGVCVCVCLCGMHVLHLCVHHTHLVAKDEAGVMEKASAHAARIARPNTFFIILKEQRGRGKKKGNEFLKKSF